jgi:L-lactate dehydrogenase complex protein LldG
MSSSARGEIMDRIRQAGRSAAPEQIARELESFGSAAAAHLPAADPCTAFLANVLLNNGSVDCADNRNDAVQLIGRYLYRRFRTHKLVAGNDPRLAAMPWREAGVLPRFGAAENSDSIALSYARLAVAETGAIVTYTGRSNSARNTLLPEDHLVLVNREDLVVSLEAAWQRIREDIRASGRPRGIQFIAGPSSTADVEGKLVMGAHGPRHWHVILVGEIPAGALDEARALATGPW